MNDLLYYIPAKKVVTPEMAGSLGLGYAVSHTGIDCVEISPGPDQQHGVLFRFSAGGFNGSERAKWEQIPNSTAWLGFDPAHPPSPADLARPKQMNGHFVRLADGNDWLVPVARAISGASPLPRRMKWDGSQWQTGDLLAQYTELFAQACRAWDTIVGATSDGLATFTDECNLAAMALAINYRIGPAEISTLGLFDTASEVEVIKALVDWPALEEIKKKLAAEKSSLTPGVED